MGGPPRAASKKRSSKASSRVHSVHLVRQDQESLAKLFWNRVGKPLAQVCAGVAAIGAAIAAVYHFYGWTGAPSLVTDHALQASITAVKTEVGRQISTTKDEVITIGNKNTLEVKNDVNDVKKNLGDVIKSLGAMSVQSLETQQRTLFMQKTNLQAQLAQVNAQLTAKHDDQFLLQRKSEIEGIIAYVDREMAGVQDQLRTRRQ